MKYPTMQQVVTFAHKKHVDIDIAREFWSQMEESGWLDWNGNPIRSWRGALINHCTRQRASGPTRSQVRDYARQRGYSVAQADEFFDYYDQVMHWHVGDPDRGTMEPMRDWMAVFTHAMGRQAEEGIVIRNPDPASSEFIDERTRQAVEEMKTRYGSDNPDPDPEIETICQEFAVDEVFARDLRHRHNVAMRQIGNARRSLLDVLRHCRVFIENNGLDALAQRTRETCFPNAQELFDVVVESMHGYEHTVDTFRGTDGESESH